MDNNIKRSIILENYQNPKNKGLINEKDYLKIKMNNESCIDEVELMVKLEDNIIKKIYFEAEACAMCISSTSIMIKTLTGKTKEEAKKIIDNFKNMINEEEYNKDIIEEAIVYEDTYKQPNRKKCVLLSWWGIEKILKEKV